MKNCLVIGISQSGKAADVREVLNRAKNDGGLTVAVTNDKTSPMAGMADYHLDCSQTVELSVAATKTFISQIYLMLSLAAAWSGDEFLNSTLDKVPEIIEKTYPLEDSLEKLAKSYRFIEDSFALGRGYAFPIAMEFALKTQETCYIRNRAYATSDFYHGPIAMISSNTPVFLFCLEKTMRADTLKMLRSVREKGGDVLLFTAIDGMDDAGATVVKLPGSNFVEGVFSASVAMQLFACKLSLARGIDPDSPRGLSKVTITR
jgi:glucosamine--fructose-6-phosphate aminotransferase (isomerizing)